MFLRTGLSPHQSEVFTLDFKTTRLLPFCCLTQKAGVVEWNNTPAGGLQVQVGSRSEVRVDLLSTVSPPLSTVALSTVLVAQSQLQFKNIK